MAIHRLTWATAVAGAALLQGVAGADSALPAPGETRRVSVLQLPLHQEASGFSKVVTVLPYGTDVTVQAVVSQPAAERQDGVPGWCRVAVAGQAAAGFVPATALVSETLYERQTAGGPAGDLAATPVGARGFSESEDKPDMSVMKGAAGQAAGGAANQAALDAACQAPPADPAQPESVAFRRAGRVGEFKP
ncbi:MAG: hypothetical protein WC708_03655 [Lentisphaeria bacterium]